MLAYKFRAYPTVEQKHQLNEDMKLCREAQEIAIGVYNKKVEEQQMPPTRNEVYRPVADAMKEKGVKNFSLFYQDAAYSVLKANRGARAKRKKGNFQANNMKVEEGKKVFSVGFAQPPVLKDVLKEKGYAFMNRYGKIKIKQHREIEGQIRAIRIKSMKGGKWFVVIITNAKYNVERIENRGEVGIDVGCEYFAVLSNGSVIENPKWWKKYQHKLAKEQRKLSRKIKGSQRYKEQRRKVARLHAHIAECREYFLHNLSKYIIQRYNKITAEKIDIAKLVQKKDFPLMGKYINDASWAKFIDMLKYKAMGANCEVNQIPAEYTTMTCSKCGNIQEMPLHLRWYKCKKCEMKMRRQWNSSQNIKNLQSQDLPMFRGEVMPAEIT